MMDQLPLAIGWVLYALLHSLLAGLRVKAAVVRLWPGFTPGTGWPTTAWRCSRSCR